MKTMVCTLWLRNECVYNVRQVMAKNDVPKHSLAIDAKRFTCASAKVNFAMVWPTKNLVPCTVCQPSSPSRALCCFSFYILLVINHLTSMSIILLPRTLVTHLISLIIYFVTFIWQSQYFAKSCKHVPSLK